MESAEKLEKKLDDRLGKPEKREEGDANYDRRMKAGRKIQKLVLKERAHRKRVAFGSVKRALREAGLQIRIEPGHDGYPHISYADENEYMGRKEARKAKTERRRKYPSTDVIPTPQPTVGVHFAHWSNVNSHGASCRNNLLPEQAVDRVVCYTGDRRILVEVHVVLIRLDRSWRKEYPPDWKWYPTPGPVTYAYFSWQGSKPVSEHFENVDDAARLIRELQQEIQKESVIKSRQEERQRVNRRKSAVDESDEEDESEKALSDGSESGHFEDEEEDNDSNHDDSEGDDDADITPP